MSRLCFFVSVVGNTYSIATSGVNNIFDFHVNRFPAE